MKKVLCMLMVAALSMLLCGCNSDVPDLTPEQTALISEYATHLLVKHSELSERNLLDDRELEKGIAIEEQERERQLKAEEIAQTYLNSEVEMIEGAEPDEDSENEGEQSEVIPSQTIAEFWGEDSFVIDYNSYELCESYPADNSEDFYMAMDATPGNQLCVVKFSVQNVMAEDNEIDMIGKKGKYLLRMDNGDTVFAQATMLLDDFAAYKGTIAGGSTEQMVLVFEVDDTITQMESAELVMKSESGENIIPLQ